MSRSFDYSLDGMENIVPSNPIQAKKAGRTRALNYLESLTLTLGALGTLSLMRGVKIMNTVFNDKQIALITIEDARFGKDENGLTTLADMIDVKSNEKDFANG